MTAPLDANEWTVRHVAMRPARQMVEELHYSHSTANTCVASHGLYDDRGRMMGVALWMPPTPPAARSVAGEEWRGVLCLSRLVVADSVPKNGASFLLGHSMRLIDRHRWPVLLTYADTRHGHTGAIYRAANWFEVGEVPAGDVWVGPEGEQRGRKRGPKNLSAAEMRAAGYVRATSAPKVKFVHRLARPARPPAPEPSLFPELAR